MIKILHTADLHLGKDFKGLGGFGEELRETIKHTFSKIIDLALERKIDLLLISGDLFNSNKVSSKLVGYVVDELRRLNGIPTCIIPGTHDCYDSNSVYRRNEFTNDLENIFIFRNSTPTTKIFERLNVAIHGRANITNLGSESPLKGLNPNKDMAFNIALAHGAIKIEGKYNLDEYAIDPKEIESSEMDYIALGHWHKCTEYSSGKTRAWYSGSPETLQFEDKDESGYVLLVNLDENNCMVEKIKIGGYSWQELNIDTSIYPPSAQLTQQILNYKGENKIVRVYLEGIISSDNSIDFSELEEELKNHFAFLRIDSSNVHPDIPINLNSLFPQGTIGHNFVQSLKIEIENSSQERKEILEEALRKGVALLSGKLRL
jgi:DNA repair exonuclease SbcCD nuclease subunit